MIEFHADDYGFFYNQSKRIIKAIDEGIIDSISVVVTGDNLRKCARLLGDRKVKTCLHINLIEGKGVARGGRDILVNEDGTFRLSFARLLMISYNPFARKRYKRRLKSEIYRQICLFSRYYGKILCIDSHVHFHVIPVVFDALVEVIKEHAIKVDYIRIPKEKISLLEIKNFKLIDLVKIIVLNILCTRNEFKYSAFLHGINKMSFFCVMRRKNMNPDVVEKRLQGVDDCEVLFHPGGCYEKGDLEQITLRADKVFFSSINRKVELKLTKELKKRMDNMKLNTMRDVRGI